MLDYTSWSWRVRLCWVEMLVCRLDRAAVFAVAAADEEQYFCRNVWRWMSQSPSGLCVCVCASNITGQEEGENVVWGDVEQIKYICAIEKGLWGIPMSFENAKKSL